MAKAILEFDLSNPEDANDYKRANKALSMAIALWDIDQYLRAQTKYAPDSMSEEAYNALSEAREKFYQILNERDINIDEILE